MSPYLLLLGLPSLLSLSGARRMGWALMLPVFAVFLVFVGWRYEVGVDWRGYLYIHLRMRYLQFEEVLFGAEPLSNTLFWIAERFADGMLTSNIVAAFILLGGVFAFARKTAEPWLALVAATPYLVIIFGMGGIRQGMAAGVFLYALSVWEKRTTVTRMAYVVLAALFHTSALLLTVFVMVGMQLRLWQKILAGAVLFVFAAYSAFTADQFAGNVEFYGEAYVYGDNIVSSPGAFLHVLLILFPAAAYLWWRRQLEPHTPIPLVLFWGAVITIGLIPLFFISSTGASRFTVYLYFVPMAIYPLLVGAVDRLTGTVMRLGVVGAHFFVLAVWLLFANNAWAYAHYQNHLETWVGGVLRTTRAIPLTW